MTFRCEYCGKEFKRESTLAKHMCKPKQRWLQKDEQHVKLGLTFFSSWYKRAMGAKKDKTYEEFVKSKYYAAFVRFGLYVIESRIFAPERYIEWLIVNMVSIDNWSKDSVYNKYLTEASKKETAERALERFILHAEQWSDRTGHHWSAYWTEVNDNRLLNDIKMGKISPWLLLSYNPAKSRLDNFPQEMLIDVADTIDIPYWQRKLDANKPTVQWIKDIMP